MLDANKTYCLLMQLYSIRIPHCHSVCVRERVRGKREIENVSHDMDLSREFVCVAKTEREMLEH